MNTDMNTDCNAHASRPRRTDQGGFTLLEAIIAMFLLTVGILAAAAMQGSAIRASTTAYERSEANNIALTMMETLQHLKFEDKALAKATYDPADEKYRNPSGGEDPEDNIKADANLYPYDRDGERMNLPAMLTDLIEEVPEKQQKKGTSCYFEDKNGKQITRGVVRDKAGGCYLLRWAVADAAKVNLENGMIVFDPDSFDTGTGIAKVNKHLRVYLDWHTPYGMENHIQFMTIKYNTSPLRPEYSSSGGGSTANP